MKAEHRKELHTNLLADRMGKMLQSIRSGPTKTSTLVWVFVLLGLGMYAFWKYYANAKASERSSLWVTVDKAGAVANRAEMLNQLGKIAGEGRGTIPGRVAEFQLARAELAEGIQSLASAQRKEAIEKVLKARQIYEQLARQCPDAPHLAQEALMSAAKAEESLIGVPNPNRDGESYGSLERALAYYQTLANDYPGSFQGLAAAERIKQLGASRSGDEGVDKFYAELNKLVSAKPVPESLLGPLPAPAPPLKPEAEADPVGPPLPKLEAKPDTKPEIKADSKGDATPKAKEEPKPAANAETPPATKPPAKEEPKKP